MPAFTFNADTEKEATMKGLRTTWSDLKKSHAVVISTNKISFSQDLGKYLDNRVPLWKAVHDAKAKLNPADKSQLAAFRTKLNALKSNAKSGQSVISTYHTSVRKLNVTATKHAYEALEKQLLSCEKAFQYDINYAESM